MKNHNIFAEILPEALLVGEGKTILRALASNSTFADKLYLDFVFAVQTHNYDKWDWISTFLKNITIFKSTMPL